MRIKRSIFDESKRLCDESIFSCASGKIGVRGCFEEGYPENTVSIRGTYINGFCETETINYNEKLFGFPDEKQTIVNLPDAQGIEIWAKEDKLCCWSNKARNYSYCLNMEEGLVTREFTYETENGEIKLSFERFASFIRSGLFVIRCKIKSINYNGKINIKSFLNADVKNFTATDDPRVASGRGKMLKVNYAENKEKVQDVEVETINSHRKMNVVTKTVIKKKDENVDVNYIKDNYLLEVNSYTELKEDEEINIEKYCFYHEVPDEIDGIEEIEKISGLGYDYLKNEQKEFMNNFWKNSRVIVEGDKVKQENIDFSIYELLSSSSRDGKASVAAKGLSGEGYEGHFFWDCEIYIYPFFLINEQEVAKSLLEYRYSKLKDAKIHARKMGHKKGALYPWRTITGSECSSHYPSGSAQYHINGDIAKAFIDYYNVTLDKDYLPHICEVLLETSRLWIDAGHYCDGSFRIDCVTGPDEYTCIVNNNYYTNAGAAYNLSNAARLINILKETDKFIEFKEKTKFEESELDEFKSAAEKMFYPCDEKLKIIAQDDSFLSKKRVDLKSFEKDEFPLLLNYHPLYLYRLQVCKQADAVLADYLFADLDATTSMNTFKYYEEVTTHDSSLSKCIFGIVAAKLGNLDLAKKYFLETLATDLDDEKGNTKDGLHIANLGGCYKMVTDGFGGLRINDEKMSIFPMLPNGFNHYSFNVRYKNRIISIYVDSKGTKLSLLNEEKPIQIEVYGNSVEVSKEEIFVERKSKAVIFDLDGVITDTAVYHYQAWKKIADELGIDFDEKKNENFKGVSRKTCLELLLEWGNKKISEKEFNEILDRKNNYYKELLEQLTPDSVLPGIIDCLNYLKDKGIKTALFSVSKNTDNILGCLNIREYFDVIVSGKDIINSKPHYEGYLLAADRMNIDHRLCTMIEDSASGIRGAKELSMNTIAIMKENVENADECVESTEKIIGVLNI